MRLRDDLAMGLNRDFVSGCAASAFEKSTLDIVLGMWQVLFVFVVEYVSVVAMVV